MATIVALFTLLLGVGIFLALVAIPSFILMILLGVLASLTGWACAIGFLPCFIIVLILGLFVN